MKIKDLPIENNPVNNGYLVYDDPAGTLTSKTEISNLPNLTPWEKGTANKTANLIGTLNNEIKAINSAVIGEGNANGIAMYEVVSVVNGLVTTLFPVITNTNTYYLRISNGIDYDLKLYDGTPAGPNQIQLTDITVNSGDAIVDCGETASGSFADPNKTVIYGRNNLSLGENNQNLNVCTFTNGNTAISSGQNSFATGSFVEANGFSSFAGGLGNNIYGRLQANGIASFHFAGAPNGPNPGTEGANGDFSAILGGQEHDVTGLNSAILGGNINTVSGDNSVILGGANRTEADNNTTNVQELRVTNNIKVNTGSNKPCDTVTLNGTGTLTVNNNLVKTGAKIFLTFNTLGGVNDHLSVPDASIVNGVSFNIISHVNDTSTVNYLIINP